MNVDSTHYTSTHTRLLSFPAVRKSIRTPAQISRHPLTTCKGWWITGLLLPYVHGGAVKVYLDSVPGVTLITIARFSLEPESDISIMLAAAGDLPAGIKNELTRIVHEVRGGNPTVRILALREVREE